jgi:putative nucleotidyltransferase with HDIG domain
MQARFLVRGWQVVLLQPESYVFKPMGTFRKTFPVIVAISVLLAILLSLFYIRKSMAPLDLLKTGMLGVASQEFHHRINLTSNDEFQELAHHFNQMSGQLAHQFNSLNTRAELDRSILSSFDRQTIIETAISGMQRIFKSDLVAINIFSKRSLKAQMYYILKTSPGVAKDTILYDEKELDQLAKYREHLTFSSKNPLPGFLNIYESDGLKHYLVLPVFVEQTLAAVIILATKSHNRFGEMAVVQARQMADQIGVALANANLMKDLNLFGWGTLRAFARAVDAKSPWTAGHSERVARLAVMIAKRMGLDKRTVENVRRAAFLHDIGKIGISSAILDKTSELTEEEIGLIRTHPDLGARILEPIEVFTPLIPMIRQHHEKYAGGGYPDGLSKEHIDLGARILSVADVYDAMVCDRPYRKAMTKDRSLTIMADESEKAFDPEVLDVFIEIATASDDLADIYPDTHGQVLVTHNLPL